MMAAVAPSRHFSVAGPARCRDDGFLTRQRESGKCGDMSNSSWRRPAIRAVAWTAGMFWLVPFFGLVDLSVPLFFQSRPEFYEGYLIESGWGVLFTFFAGLPLCFLGARPRWTSAALVSGAAGVAVLITSVAAGQPLHLVIAAALVLPSVAIIFLDPGIGGTGQWPLFNGASLTATRAGIGVPLLGLALIALPPAIVYASAMVYAAITAVPEPDYTYVFDHYPVQAASALVIPLATALLALLAPGWRPMAFLVAAGTAWFGLVSVVYPAHLGSWGAVWGWTAVAWAVALAALAVPFGRDRPDSRR